MINSGKWTEAESENRMQDLLKEISKDIPTEFDEKRVKREFRNLLDLMTRVQNPQKLFEKKYYFDEGLGQSLKDHVEELKATFPDL